MGETLNAILTWKESSYQSKDMAWYGLERVDATSRHTRLLENDLVYKKKFESDGSFGAVAYRGSMLPGAEQFFDALFSKEK